MSKETSQGDAKRVQAIREAAKVASEKRPIPDGLVSAMIAHDVSVENAAGMLDRFIADGWIMVGGAQFGDRTENVG